LVTFDREGAAEYANILTCKDHGTPSLTGSVIIEVKITDENDNSPILSSDVLIAEVKENNAAGSLVTTIAASDADEGRNRAMLYRLHPLNDTADNILTIDPIMGRVTAVVSFDYEKRQEYHFLLTVSDHGETPRSASAKLHLYIIDVNDETPRFDKSSYQFSTMENRPIGTSVGRVNASDYDLTDDYRIIGFRI